MGLPIHDTGSILRTPSPLRKCHNYMLSQVFIRNTRSVAAASLCVQIQNLSYQAFRYQYNEDDFLIQF